MRGWVILVDHSSSWILYLLGGCGGGGGVEFFRKLGIRGFQNFWIRDVWRLSAD